MEIRLVGDALMRSQKFTPTFLIPLISSRCPSIAQRTLDRPHRRQLQKKFTSSTRADARSESITTSAQPPAQNGNSVASKPSKPLDWLAGATSKRTNPISPPHSSYQAPFNNGTPTATNTPSSSSSATESELLMNKGNSASDLLARLNAVRAGQPLPPSPINTVDPTMAPGKIPRFEYADLMKDISRELSNAPPPERAPMRLTPATGRTVDVTQTVDVGRSFRLMEQLVARNKVRSTFNFQRFHERPGLKRKRLKSLRWRKRFMLGFRAAVNRVKQLKKQGW